MPTLSSRPWHASTPFGEHKYTGLQKLSHVHRKAVMAVSLLRISISCGIYCLVLYCTVMYIPYYREYIQVCCTAAWHPAEAC
jgi:hypothetical protein